MKSICISLFIVLLLFSGCSYIDNYNSPTLELSGSSPYILRISDFDWNYGMVQINQYSGDFEKLDRKVFDLLKGKTGTCDVYMINKSRDKYGTEGTDMELIGEIDLAELNKYENWEYWHKSSGIIALLNEKNFPKPKPIVKEEKNEWDSIVSAIKAKTKTKVVNTTTETFSVNHEELYPEDDERASHDFQSYTTPITGIISYSDYFNNIMEVRGDDGDLYALRIFPENLSTYAKSQIRYFMRKGNRIRCIATLAGARELEIVSATFTLITK